MHSNWRDCRAWYDEKLPMNTSSNEASKFYDICLSQLAGYYENHQFGGISDSLSMMINADPNFILGHCLKNGIELLGTNFSLTSNSYQKSIADLVLKSESLSDELTRSGFEKKNMKNGSVCLVFPMKAKIKKRFFWNVVIILLALFAEIYQLEKYKILFHFEITKYF